MSCVPSESNTIASLYALRFYGINMQIPTLTVMDSFYARITPLKFPSAKEASSYCRQLAREYGFTMKQETSSNRNIYIYCSREGITDSGKQTKRKRSSIKCDCKWRIVLFKDNSQWEFRKSNNPQHAEHNHDLIPPENIPAPWPPNVLHKIAEYASSGLPTGDIRQLMQQEFPSLPWDERRFYNRLAEERKKIKVRETEKRVVETIILAARVASLACSSHVYTNKVKTVLQQVFDDICESANIDPTSVNSSSQDNMTTISLPPSSTADIVCSYPAGSITVKNIPAQKGRPPKKNICQKFQQSQSQLQIEYSSPQLQEINHQNQNDLTTTKPSQQSELASTYLQNQIELSIHSQSQTEFETQSQLHNSQSQSQVQFQSQQQFLSQETANIQEELYQNVVSNELNPSFLQQIQSQPILQSPTNFYPPDEQFQKQEQFYQSQLQSFIQCPQTNSNNNQPQEHREMKIHLHLQNQHYEQINKHEQQILDSSSQTEETTFAKHSLPTQTLQEMFLPQVFTQPQENNVKQKLLRSNSQQFRKENQDLQPSQFNHLQSPLDSSQDSQSQVNQPQVSLYSSNSIQFTNTNQKQQISNMNYEKAKMKHTAMTQQNTWLQQTAPNTGGQYLNFIFIDN